MGVLHHQTVVGMNLLMAVRQKEPQCKGGGSYKVSHLDRLFPVFIPQNSFLVAFFFLNH